MRALTASLLCLIAAIPTIAHAQSNCRLYLMGQYGWTEQKGFYLDLEGNTLAKLPVILGVADGKGWRFISNAPGFVTHREYLINASIGPQGATLSIDGEEVAQTGGGWEPFATGPLMVNDRPGWANEPGDWICVMTKGSAVVLREGKEVERKEFDFGEMGGRPLQLMYFEPSQPTASTMAPQAGDTVQLEARMRFASSDFKAHAPFVDRYGQCKYAVLPEKVTSDDELIADIAKEDAELDEIPPSPDFDAYGGWLKSPWKEQGTGFFRTLKRDGKWWLITPEGNPCFHVGVCAAPSQFWECTPVSGREFVFEWLPPKEGLFAGAWSKNLWGINDGTEYLSLYACNLIRKYGDAWHEKARERAVRRLRSFGFQGGKWGSPRELAEPVVIGRGSTPNLAGHPDVFDPAVCATLREELTKQITPRLNDPNVLGWSVGNEYDEIVKRNEVREIMERGPETPAKKALVDYAVDQLYGGDAAKTAQAWKLEANERELLYTIAPTLPDADVERLRCFYEDRYYETLYTTIKSIDPNHLYLGNWIVPTWWESEEDWRIHAKHLDVIGYDRYTRDYQSGPLMRLQAETDKPTLCGEFSMPAWDGGMRAYGRYPCWAKDEEESGALYEGWVRGATADPYCVGLTWFLFRDQPVTGRGPGRGPQLVIGEHYAFGLITEQDRVKWTLVKKMREANLKAAEWRNGGER